MTGPEAQPLHALSATPDRPDDVAVRSGGRSLSWRDLEARMRRFANGLHGLGFDESSTWGLLSRNRLEWAELALGNARAGCLYVPLNWHLTEAEIAELLVDSGATLLIVEPRFEDVGRSAVERAGGGRVIVLGDEYEAWLAEQSDHPPRPGPVGVPLQYTGGTTGRSKGVRRAGVRPPAAQLVDHDGRWGDYIGMPSHSPAMLCTPAYHALGGAMLRSGLSRGNSMEILDGFDPIEVLTTIEQRRIAATVMVPTQFIRMLKLDPETRARFDVSSIEWVLHTAAPCPGWTKQQMIDWFGPVIVELYGSSEGIGPVIATSQEWLERPGTVGRATSALEISVIGDDGNDLPPGEVGTIYARRPEGTPAYHGDPDKTAAMVRADGRFTVGDVGWLDEDGYLFLADRRVDLILSGGTNIYPAEIEATLSRHPQVADVAVFGVPNAEWGQEVKAVVEPVPGTEIDVGALLEFAAEELARFKLPRSIDVVDALPREASGKLKKRLLRDPYWEEAAPEGVTDAS